MKLEDLLKEKLDDNIIAAMEEHIGEMHGGELWRLWLQVHRVEWEVWRLCVSCTKMEALKWASRARVDRLQDSIFSDAVEADHFRVIEAKDRADHERALAAAELQDHKEALAERMARDWDDRVFVCAWNELFWEIKEAATTRHAAEELLDGEGLERIRLAFRAQRRG